MLELLVGQERWCRFSLFSCRSASKQDFLDPSGHAILKEEDTVFILSKKEIYLLDRRKNVLNASWHLPDWAVQFHEMQLCGGFRYDGELWCDRYLCLGVQSINHNGNFYSYFIVNLNKKRPLVLSSENCPHFYFQDGRFPVNIFNHPYIGNKLFFYSQDPEANSAVYMVDLWSHNQQFNYSKIVQHTKPIVNAAFSEDGLQLIIQDNHGAQIAFSTPPT